MEIAFQTKSLRDLCERGDRISKQFGDRVGEAIKARLADLRAASTISDVVAGNPRVLTIDGKPVMSLDVHESCSLVFCPNHLRVPLLPDASVNWSAVSRIKILKIGSDNG